MYGHYLSQTAANRMFNPTAAQQDRVSTWLTQSGLHVSQVFPNQLAIDATGTTSAVDKIFGVTLARYQATIYGKMSRFFAPTSSPVVPAQLDGIVESVLGPTVYLRTMPPPMGHAMAHLPTIPRTSLTPMTSIRCGRPAMTEWGSTLA